MFWNSALDALVVADSQEGNFLYFACVSIACKQDAVGGQSELQADGQRFLDMLAGFLRVRPPVGKVQEVLTCSPSRVDFIVSLRACVYHKLLQCWANPPEADLLSTFCAWMPFTPTGETPVLNISDKLGSADWLFPWQRCNSGGMLKNTPFIVLSNLNHFFSWGWWFFCHSFHWLAWAKPSWALIH